VVTETNNLAVMYPELAKEYSDRNKLPVDRVIAGTSKKLWWKCSTCGHEWETTGNTRLKGSGCPACANQVLTETNNLAAKYPELVKEYSPRNPKPSNQVLPVARERLWWICKNGHEWQSNPYSRIIRGSGCRACATQAQRKKERLLRVV
jgi:DNA-directed RNA polymerase subunit RPC12/RpoP